MARPFRPIARLIAAILLLQVVLAPAHCLAMASVPAGLAAVLCSPEGQRVVHLGPDGQEMPADHAPQGFCPACAGLPQAILPHPSQSASAPAWTVAGVAPHPTRSDALPPPARAPPFAPRAPPAFA